MRAFFIASLLLSSTSLMAQIQTVTLSKVENIRVLVKDVLEIEEELPAGTIISFPRASTPETHLYRTRSGQVERSSNGFLPSVQIVSSDLHPERIQELNELQLWISVAVRPLEQGREFSPVQVTEFGEGFLKNFETTGQPKFNFTSYFKTRFPKSLNRSIMQDEQSEAERLKWQSIMKELKAAGDRSVPTSTRYLYIPLDQAREASIAYENKDEVGGFGAWTIAVKATAVRHGFPNVPCAEFMSEMIRQAYRRAGQDLFDDFNEKNGTRLIWNKTAAVVNLTNTLYKAGWIPWELAYYRPPTGAIMAHFKATTPGHVYMAAGLDGKLIVDNGSPAGRALSATSEKTIKMMYYGGVFFLPPGIIPQGW